MAKKATKKPAKKTIKKVVVKKRKAPVKQIINLMNMDTVEPKDYLKVTSINPDSENMTEVFGITKERFRELDILIMTAMKSTDRFSGAVEMVSQQCKHANELAMCVVLLSEERHRVLPIQMIMSAIRKGPGPNPGEE